MPRNRAGAQLAIQAPPELLERLRAAALAQRRTVTALVIEAIEAALSGGPAAADPVAPALLERLERLEVALAQLQQAPPAAPLPLDLPAPVPERVEPLRVPLDPGQLEIIGAAHLQAPDPAPLDLPAPAVHLPPAAPGSRLTSGELADLTGTNRAGWNNWAAADRVGEVRRHREAGSWRLVGKAPAPTGGPDRWLWERVAPVA